MTVYELGDTVTLTLAGDSGDDAQLFVTAPNGTESTPAVTYSAPNWSGSLTANQYDVWEYAWRLDGDIVDTGTFSVGRWYASLASLKKATNRGSSDSTADDQLADALDAASRSVEQYCDSRPIGGFLLAASTSARTYRPSELGPASPGVVFCTPLGYRLHVHEIGATGYTVETSDDGSTWTELTEDTDYETWPENALSLSRPVEAFVLSTLPTRVRATAKWGWPAVPSAVRQATLLQASRLYRRKDSPEGVAGSSEWGVIRVPNLDPDVKALLSWLHTEALIA